MSDFKALIKGFGDRIPDKRKEAENKLIVYVS